jgi:hypothetical protein
MQSRSSKERDAKTPGFKRDVWFPMEAASTTHTNLPKQPARADRSNTRASLRWSAVVSGHGNPNAPSLTHEDSREEHMKKILVFATLALIAAACSNAPQTVNTSVIDSTARGSRTPSVDSSKYEVAGMLEVTVSGIKPNSSEGTTTAKFFAADKSGKLSSKGLLVPNSSVTFTPQYVSSFDTFSGPTTTRYVEAGFAITNNSPTTYYNMTMVAASLAAATTSSGVTTTVGGTALSDILNGGGAPITDVAVARSMNPVHGFTPAATYAPSSSKADLHYLTAAEAASVKAQGQSTGQIPAININKVFPLEYGFVARNAAGTGRTISPSTCAPVNCNKGNVTFAYSFPLNPSIANQPYSYKMQFVVANEFIATWSQMLTNETGTVAGVPFANPLISTHRSRILEYRGADKKFIPASGVDLLDNVCSIKTANAVGGAPALQYPVVNPTFAGVWDGCFGEGGQRARTYSTAFNTASSVSVDPITDQIVIAGATGIQGSGGWGTKIALAKFDKTGKQTMAVEYTPLPTQLNGGPYIKVKKVIVSKTFGGEIYVFGYSNDFGSEFPIGGIFVIRFTPAGVANGFYKQGSQLISNVSTSELSGDMYLDQSSTVTPPVAYVLYNEETPYPASTPSWNVTAINAGPTGTLGVLSTFGNLGTFSFPVAANHKPTALTGNASNMVMVGYDTSLSPTSTSTAVLNFAIDYSGNLYSPWGFGGYNAFYASPVTTGIGQNTLLIAGAKFSVTSAKLLSNGKLLVAGTARTGAAVTTDADTFIFQSTAAGALDTAGFTPGAFINTATRFYNCSPSVTTDDLVPAITVRPNGEIFVVSYGSTGHCVARLSAIGTVLSTQDYDLAFGYVKSPASSAQFTAAGRLAIGGTAGTSAIVGLIKQ